MEPASKLFGISQAAAQLGVHQNTLRAWVDKGLVPVTRLPSGYRRFSTTQLKQIQRTMARLGPARPIGATPEDGDA